MPNILQLALTSALKQLKDHPQTAEVLIKQVLDSIPNSFSGSSTECGMPGGIPDKRFAYDPECEASKVCRRQSDGGNECQFPPDCQSYQKSNDLPVSFDLPGGFAWNPKDFAVNQDTLKAIIDEVFALLDAATKAYPLAHLALGLLHALAVQLLPQILSSLKSKAIVP